MTSSALRERLDALVAQEGVSGCALVVTDTGMVLEWVGLPEHVPVFEAACDYWRLCGRQPAFAVLGAPRAQVVMHSDMRLTIVCCGNDFLLVTVSREDQVVDWARWKRAVNELARMASTL